ncbi:mannose-1-phosphate guanylyltransferase [Candidatus Epulonipiscium fishelsonii]|nr:mannose-1-phosphate guanylyltransferase [Epulopiscium sp. SCG-C06WGA-EpuloA1]
MKITVLIMAGGKGERFWPKSRKNFPKQFLNLTSDNKTMIQHTVERISELVEEENIFIVTNKEYKDLVYEQLPNIPMQNILLEPMAKNTAPCIGLAAMHIKKKYEDAIMIVLPADHLIKYTELFIDTLKEGIKVAEEDSNLVTIGIMPSYPETGYGYINFGSRKENHTGVYNVKHFVEKPNIEKAKEYLSSGKYLWNSGIFIWKVGSILENFKNLLPQIYEDLIPIYESIGQPNEDEIVYYQFNKMKAVSIDYAIMEQAENIFTIPGNFGWDDVGSWLTLERINTTNESGNVVKGNVITIDTFDSIIQAEDKLIALVGIEDLIVVDTEDALLIVDKNKTQDIKKVVENLKICNRNQYL